MADTTQPGADNALDLDKLEALARAADPGIVSWHSKWQVADGITDDDDCDYIEALTPAAVLALIALARRAAQPVAPAGYVLMPRELTAANGAKGTLSGEFREHINVPCPECNGDEECTECGGDGYVEQGVMVEWDTIKRIYAAAVELLAVPAVGGALVANAEPLGYGFLGEHTGPAAPTGSAAADRNAVLEEVASSFGDSWIAVSIRKLITSQPIPTGEK